VLIRACSMARQQRRALSVLIVFDLLFFFFKQKTAYEILA